MQKIRLDVIGLSSGQTQGSYTLILGEEAGKRKLAIIIGSFEAQAIAIQIEKIVPFRPMTHDLFVSFAKQFNISINQVVIHDLKEGVFYARLICQRADEEIEIDARTSDAISIAVRVGCPIFTYEHIMQEAGHEFNLPDQEGDDESSEPGTPDHEAHEIELPPGIGSAVDFSSLNNEELNQLLDEAIREEDYHRAAIIRDELNRRK